MRIPKLFLKSKIKPVYIIHIYNLYIIYTICYIFYILYIIYIIYYILYIVCMGLEDFMSDVKNFYLNELERHITIVSLYLDFSLRGSLN